MGVVVFSNAAFQHLVFVSFSLFYDFLVTSLLIAMSSDKVNLLPL